MASSKRLKNRESVGCEGSRNPKPDQLLKIANALGVSINVFTDFDIETASDVLTLLCDLLPPPTEKSFTG